MAAKCKKCDPHEICEECPEWIFTLADLIMCMMGLFVLLWVLKTSGEPAKPQLSEQEIKTLIGIREAFGWVPDPDSDDPVDQAALRNKAIAPRSGDDTQGRQVNPVEGAEGVDPEVQRIRPGDQSTVGAPIRFERGSSKLSDSARRQLDQVITLVRGHRQVFLIKGHVSLDDLNEGSDEAARMNLSIARAQAVVDYMQSKGVASDTMRLQGCSAFEPLVQRARRGDESLAANRRVEVESSSMLVRQLQATSD
ncbi:MAG TPA: OmpA family protein [Tepidisphaeraceae bacterium]|nr:OmpA family protein [Tepidisphaeraceae bacterium]